MAIRQLEIASHLFENGNFVGLYQSTQHGETTARFEVLTNENQGVTYSPYYDTIGDAIAAWSDTIAQLAFEDEYPRETPEPTTYDADTWVLTLRKTTWGQGITWQELQPIFDVLATMPGVHFSLKKA